MTEQVSTGRDNYRGGRSGGQGENQGNSRTPSGDQGRGRGGRGVGGGGRFAFGGGRGEGGRGTGGGDGPSGRNRHMGEVDSIAQAMRTLSDSSILTVINPPEADRRSRSTQLSLTPDTCRLPSHHPFRMANSIGVILSPQHIIRTNHFRVDTSHVVPQIYHYHVHIRKANPSSIGKATSREDVAGKEDSRITMTLLKQLRNRHPEWEALHSTTESVSKKGQAKAATNASINQLGFAYDGASALFLNARLPLSDRNAKGEDVLIEEIGLVDKDGKMMQYVLLRIC